MDVEYARNVITTMLGSNELGQQHFFDKAMKSFNHTPALLHTTFSDISPVNIQGMTIGVFTLDVERIKKVMVACVRALHFLETNERVCDWEIVLPNLHFSNKDTTEAEAASWRNFLSLFRLFSFSEKRTTSSDVFEYAIGDIEGGRVYRLRFYKGFLVFAFRK